MKLSRSVYFILIALVMLFVGLSVYFLVNGNRDVFSQSEVSFDEGGNIAAPGFEPLNEEIKLSNLLLAVRGDGFKNLKGINDDDANRLVDLRDFEGLEKRVAISDSQNEYTEIWLLKISDRSQIVDLFDVLSERVDSLGVDSSDFILKVQDDIVIFVVSSLMPLL